MACWKARAIRARTAALWAIDETQRIGTIGEGAEQIGDIGVVHRLPRIIGHEVLLGHIGHIVALIVLGQEMIEWLIFHRPVLFGNRRIPFFGVGEFRVDVKNHAPKGMLLVTDNLPEVIFCACSYHNMLPLPLDGSPFKGLLSNHSGSARGNRL